jgi:membrane protein
MSRAAPSRSPGRTLALGEWPNRLKAIARELAAAFREHHLWTYASAISFRALVALVPLVLLGLGLLGALGLEDVWSNSIAPAVKGHVTQPVFEAIDSSVEKIFASSTAGLVAFAAGLLVWDMTWAISLTREALNELHGVTEDRSLWRRGLVATGLAIAVIVCVVASVLAVVLGPRPEGTWHVVFGLGRWPAAVVLLGIAVGLLVRYAPAEKPPSSWASAGSLVVVGGWILATVAFGWWAGSVANFETAIGSLTVFLVLTAYVFTSSAIFLVGVQLDEILRKSTRGN